MAGWRANSRIPGDNFSARWTRSLGFDAGRYRFHIAGDDGFRLWIDGNAVIDKWIYQSRTEHTGDLNLSAGTHDLRIEYFEAGGDANISFWSERLGDAAGGFTPDPDRTYRIISVNSGKGLDVSGALQGNGARVQQWTYAGGTNQRWRFEALGNGFYRIRAVHSGKCLDVYGAWGDDGAAVQQWECHGGANQQWQLSTAGNAIVLLAKHSGKALDVYGASSDNGAAVQQWQRHDGANQRWLIEAVS